MELGTGQIRHALLRGDKVPLVELDFYQWSKNLVNDGKRLRVESAFTSWSQSDFSE